MSKTPLNLPILQHVFHPSDFSPASEIAFAHALKAALIAKATLTVLHVSPGGEQNWTEFPGVRQTLERWGMLPKNSPKSAVPELGIQVRKIITKDKDPVKAVLGFLEQPSQRPDCPRHASGQRARPVAGEIRRPTCGQEIASDDALHSRRREGVCVVPGRRRVAQEHLDPCRAGSEGAACDSGRRPDRAAAQLSHRPIHHPPCGRRYHDARGQLSGVAGMGVDEVVTEGRHHRGHSADRSRDGGRSHRHVHRRPTTAFSTLCEAAIVNKCSGSAPVPCWLFRLVGGSRPCCKRQSDRVRTKNGWARGDARYEIQDTRDPASRISSRDFPARLACLARVRHPRSQQTLMNQEGWQIVHWRGACDSGYYQSRHFPGRHQHRRRSQGTHRHQGGDDRRDDHINNPPE